MKPLTAEQSQIAELNHDLVFEFLNEYNLPESQYYDVVIFGYLCAVQEYCENHNNLVLRYKVRPNLVHIV